jgi:hypothetical protein
LLDAGLGNPFLVEVAIVRIGHQLEQDFGLVIGSNVVGQRAFFGEGSAGCSFENANVFCDHDELLGVERDGGKLLTTEIEIN